MPKFNPLPHPYRPRPPHRRHPRHERPEWGEARAVVLEAEMVEWETLAATDLLLAEEILEAEEEADDEPPVDPTPEEVVADIAETAAAIAETAGQLAAGASPYAALGGQVVPFAKDIVQAIDSYDPTTPIQPPGGR